MAEANAPAQRKPHARMDLTEGPISRTLLLFSLPVLGSSVLQSINASINAIWVGRLLGENALTATANATLILLITLGVMFGTGMASTILVGQAVGWDLGVFDVDQDGSHGLLRQMLQNGRAMLTCRPPATGRRRQRLEGVRASSALTDATPRGLSGVAGMAERELDTTLCTRRESNINIPFTRPYRAASTPPSRRGRHST